MNQNRFSYGLIAGILVALFFGVALYLRVALPYTQVFVGDWIKFTGVDASFFMRVVDNLVHNFPHLNSFDPYVLYPGGGGPGPSTFFEYLIATVCWVFGLGSPSQHTVDVVGVYFPAILGALTVIPVYFIGKALFNRWAGVIAAGLIAIFPGEFLGRSILGFTDYHVAEVLFTTTSLLFLILALKSATQSGMTLKHVKNWGWKIIFKPFIYSLIAGIFLGIYFLTWQGALLFVFIIFIYFVVQFIIDHFKSRPTSYICFVSTITLIVTLLICLPASLGKMTLASLIIAIVIPIVLAVTSHFMASRSIKPAFYLAAILGLALVSLAAFHIVNPSLLRTMLRGLYIFTWPIGTTNLEMQPLLFPGGNFSLAIAWGNFNTSFFLCFISLGILIYLAVKRSDNNKMLFIIWSLVMLAATLSMRRFAYYFVVNVALLAGYLAWLIVEFSGFREEVAEPAETLRETKPKKKDKQRKERRGGSRSATGWLNKGLGLIVVFFLFFFPNIGGAINTASNPVFAPSDAWCESLSWMRTNTPEPFGDSDFYYARYGPPPPGESYAYPKTAYGVTAWWDYGYWITRIGRRIPTSNPGSGHTGEAFFFTAQDEASANGMIDNWGWGSKYVIVDYAITAVVQGKFYALATLSRNSPEMFFGVYYQLQDNNLKPVVLFYPEYYRSLVIRLYNFDGSQVVPENSTVISYSERVARDGQPYKEITDAKSFHSYEEAEAYISSQESTNYRIVSPDPFASPVPLQALEHYKPVYSSDGSKMMPSGKLVPEVKIFEYVK